MTEELTFKDPPSPPQYKKRRWISMAEPLKEHPGKWVMFGPFIRSVAINGLNALKKQGYEATTHKIADEGDTHELYARWPDGDS